MKQIPDAAVQAALEYYSEGGCMGLELYERKEVATAMLEAALPYLQPVDVAAVRRQAFEEAAKAAEAVWPNSGALDIGHGSRIAAAIRALSAKLAQGVRPLEEWHEDHGNVVWWAWDNDKKEWFGEPAYIGKPLDSDWPEYHTHWTPHPPLPTAPTTEAEA